MNQKRRGGRGLCEDVIFKVQGFYQSDEISRAYPVKKEFAPVKINGGKVYKQKLLLVTNSKERHIGFIKKKNMELWLPLSGIKVQVFLKKYIKK